jgi:WD40 repeat protein
LRWNIETGRQEASVRAHQGPIWSLAIDQSTQTVATAGDDGIIRLWLLPGLLPVTAPNTLRSPRPYEGMNISEATGLAKEQKEALTVLGAIDMSAH